MRGAAMSPHKMTLTSWIIAHTEKVIAFAIRKLGIRSDVYVVMAEATIANRGILEILSIFQGAFASTESEINPSEEVQIYVESGQLTGETTHEELVEFACHLIKTYFLCSSEAIGAGIADGYIHLEMEEDS